MNLFATTQTSLSLLFAAILTFIYLAQSFYVVLQRFRANTSLGSNSDAYHPLSRAIRVHGNFIEYTPIFLILFFLAENNELSATYLKILGWSFVIGRLAHWFGLMQKNSVNPFRQVGMVLTFTPLALMAGWSLVKYL